MTKGNKRVLLILLCCVLLAAIALIIINRINATPDGNGPQASATNTPTASATPSPTPTATPSATPETTPTPSASPEPTGSAGEQLIIRTDYEAFKPNEVGEIPVIMFHNFVESLDDTTDKEYTTSFELFEELLQTLYDAGFVPISMKDFIDSHITVPAGKMPVVFTFDDGSAGQFNLIRENGKLIVNPNSAVGVLVEFNKKHPDFGLKGIFYVNMNLGDNTFKGEGTQAERFELLESLGFELGSHTWGHVDFNKAKNTEASIQEAMGKNQEAAFEILPSLKFYSLALPYGSRPSNEALRLFLRSGEYNGTAYYHENIMAVGANPTVPSIAVKYNPMYVSRIRAQGKIAVECDLTWWLPKMTASRMYVSDGDPMTIVIPESKADLVNQDNLNGKKLITY